MSGNDMHAILAEAARNDHLPECAQHQHDDVSAHCICDRLRACEARVRREVIDQPDTHATYVYRAGRAEGLDAAREAVAALLGEPAYVAGGLAALAAIDALRGES